MLSYKEIVMITHEEKYILYKQGLDEGIKYTIKVLEDKIRELRERDYMPNEETNNVEYLDGITTAYKSVLSLLTSVSRDMNEKKDKQFLSKFDVEDFNNAIPLNKACKWLKENLPIYEQPNTFKNEFREAMKGG